MAHVAEMQRKEEEMRQMFVVRVKEKEAELKAAENEVCRSRTQLCRSRASELAAMCVKHFRSLGYVEQDL